ncbi:MAG: CsgG/HfaB family protein [Archangium sp.]|nr:CsgG/HfaB family protein [Archangium sp.]MDP3574875.1 CsgG/HfaB family protein [Archangium sp.]
MLALALVTLLAAADSPVVSVMYFDNDSKDPELEFMRKGLTDLLITDLVAWEGVRVVERTRLEDVLKELNFQQTKYVDKASAAKLGKVLNSTYLIYGSMLMLSGGKLIVTARLVQASNGEVLLTVKEQDERDKIFDLEQRLVNQLVAKIDAKLSANDQGRRKAKVPNLETLVAYGKALDLSDQGKIDEAQAAMRAVVSKSPTFLLGRERQTELLKAFEEYQKKKKDLIAGRVLELGKMVEEAMKDESKFDALTKEQKERYLSMRMLKGRFLARVMKQYLTNRDENFRVARKGSEGKALLAMRDWAENQRRFISEYARWVKQHGVVSSGVSLAPSFSYRPSDAEAQLIQDSKIGDSGLRDEDLETLAEFVLLGRVTDGTSFTVAPTLGAADPKETKAVNEQLDFEIKNALSRHTAGDKQAEWQATRLLQFRAKVAVSEGNLDEAIGFFQQVLDAFPTGSSATSVEKRIKDLLEGRTNELSALEDYQAAIKTCDDMKIRKSHDILRKRMLKSGLKAIDEYAADLEKACLPATNRTQGAFSQIYGYLAHDAAAHDDCERYLAYYRKYLELNGSIYDMFSHAKNRPWCDISPLKNDVTYLHARLDDDRDFSDMTRHVVSILSIDKTVLTVGASTQGPRVPGGEEESFDLRLERQKDGKYVCAQARWRRSNGRYIEGTCKVSLAKMTPNENGPGFDEGTFDALFPKSYEVVPGVMRDIKLSKGEFRVRRQ